MASSIGILRFVATETLRLDRSEIRLGTPDG